MTVYTIYDFIFFPAYLLAFLVMLYFYSRTSGISSQLRSKLQTGFLVRVIYTFLYFLIQQFYFGAGDSFGYYNSIKDLHEMDESLSGPFVSSITSVVSYGSGLYYAFSQQVLGLVNGNLSNAAVVKIGYWLAYLCGQSYLTLCLFYSMFAFLGCWKLYLLLTRYYPKLYREFAICLLFLPSVCFWSSGLLKDSLTLGALGLLIGSLHDLAIDKKKVFISIIKAVVFGYIILVIKPYILLAITPGLLIWLFGKFNFQGLNKAFRNLITVLFILVAAAIGALLINYFGSTEYAKDLSTENLTDRIDQMRDVYDISEETRGGSYFTTGSDNPVLNLFLGMIATLFRPFPWEARNFTMLFSAIEAFVFMMVTLYIFIKLGFINTFKRIFKNGETVFFFIFSVIFAAAVGSSTANFGTLVRYKIPCLPFYFMMLFIIMHTSDLKYPKWLNWIVGIRKKAMIPKHLQ